MKQSWKQSIERARRANSAGFKAKMEVADASFEQIPEDGAGAEGRTLADFAEQADITYSSLANYRMVRVWLGDFLRAEKIPNFQMAKTAVAHMTPEELVELLKKDPPEDYKRWTVAALEEYLEEQESPWPLFQQSVNQIHADLRNTMDLALTKRMSRAIKEDARLRNAIIGHCNRIIRSAETVKKEMESPTKRLKVVS